MTTKEMVTRKQEPKTGKREEDMDWRQRDDDEVKVTRKRLQHFYTEVQTTKREQGVVSK